MKNKEEMIQFFNEQASDWEKGHNQRTYQTIKELTQFLNLNEKSRVLDIAAGCGILYLPLQRYDIQKYHAIEISPGMVHEFCKIYPQEEITLLDFETPFSKHPLELQKETFSHIIIFNAMPHFSNFEILFQNCFQYLQPLGKLAIAHSRTREELNIHHSQKKIVNSHTLPSTSEFISWGEEAGFGKFTIQESPWFYFQAQKI